MLMPNQSTIIMNDYLYIIRTWAGFFVCRSVFVQPRINSRPYPSLEMATKAAKEFASAWKMRQRKFTCNDIR